jgi:hypothetical protein
VRVDVERILALKAELREINNVDLKDIEFFQNGEPLKISPLAVEDFRFIGMNNTDFITSGFYKD